MLCFFCVERHDKMQRNKRYNAYSVVTTHVKRPRVDYAFACQPWAIIGTTLTALRIRIFVTAKGLIRGGDVVDNKT